MQEQCASSCHLAHHIKKTGVLGRHGALLLKQHRGRHTTIKRMVLSQRSLHPTLSPVILAKRIHACRCIAVRLPSSESMHAGDVINGCVIASKQAHVGFSGGKRQGTYMVCWLNKQVAGRGQGCHHADKTAGDAALHPPTLHPSDVTPPRTSCLPACPPACLIL